MRGRTPTALLPWHPRSARDKPPALAVGFMTVELIPEQLASGATPEDLLRGYPRLTEAGVRAALAYAARVLGSDVVYLDAPPPAPAPTTEVAG